MTFYLGKDNSYAGSATFVKILSSAMSLKEASWESDETAKAVEFFKAEFT